MKRLVQNGGTGTRDRLVGQAFENEHDSMRESGSRIEPGIWTCVGNIELLGELISYWNDSD